MVNRFLLTGIAAWSTSLHAEYQQLMSIAFNKLPSELALNARMLMSSYRLATVAATEIEMNIAKTVGQNPALMLPTAVFTGT